MYFLFFLSVHRIAKYDGDPLDRERFLISQHCNFKSKLNITFCNFLNIFHSSRGGAILHYSSSPMHIEHSLFSDVHSSVDGGVIYKVKGCLFLIYDCICNCSCVSMNETNNLVSNTVACQRCLATINCSAVFNSLVMSNEQKIATMKFRSGNTTLFSHNVTRAFGRESAILGELYKSPSIVLFVQTIAGENECCYRGLGSKSSSDISFCNFLNNTVNYLLGDCLILASQCAFYYNTMSKEAEPFKGIFVNLSFVDFKYETLWLMDNKEKITQKQQSYTPAFCDFGTFPMLQEHGAMDVLVLPQEATLKPANSEY